MCVCACCVGVVPLKKTLSEGYQNGGGELCWLQKVKEKNSFFNRKQLTPSVLFDKGVVVVVVYLVWFFLPPIKKHTTSIFCREYHTRIKK